jgi:hypothetical protein
MNGPITMPANMYPMITLCLNRAASPAPMKAKSIMIPISIMTCSVSTISVSLPRFSARSSARDGWERALACWFSRP